MSQHDSSLFSCCNASDTCLLRDVFEMFTQAWRGQTFLHELLRSQKSWNAPFAKKQNILKSESAAFVTHVDVGSIDVVRASIDLNWQERPKSVAWQTYWETISGGDNAKDEWGSFEMLKLFLRFRIPVERINMIGKQVLLGTISLSRFLSTFWGSKAVNFSSRFAGFKTWRTYCDKRFSHFCKGRTNTRRGIFFWLRLFAEACEVKVWFVKWPCGTDFTAEYLKLFLQLGFFRFWIHFLQLLELFLQLRTLNWCVTGHQRFQ